MMSSNHRQVRGAYLRGTSIRSSSLLRFDFSLLLLTFRLNLGLSLRRSLRLGSLLRLHFFFLTLLFYLRSNLASLLGFGLDVLLLFPITLLLLDLRLGLCFRLGSSLFGLDVLLLIFLTRFLALLLDF